jgi:hypothetical protein
MALIKIKSESMNLADDYTFTGTVTGAGDPADVKLISTTNVTTNVGSVDFETFSTDYQNFIIKCTDLIPSVNGTQLSVRLKTSGGYEGDSTSYNNVRQRIYHTGGSSYTSNSGGFSASYGVLGLGQNSSGNGNVETGSHALVYLFDVHNTNRGKGYTGTFWGAHDNGTASVMQVSCSLVGGSRLSAITGFRLYFDGGNIDVGSFSLYGVKK